MLAGMLVSAIAAAVAMATARDAGFVLRVLLGDRAKFMRDDGPVPVLPCLNSVPITMGLSLKGQQPVDSRIDKRFKFTSTRCLREP